MAISLANDATLEVTLTEPATLDLAGFKAATFTEVGEVVSIPEFGGTKGSIEVSTLKTIHRFPGTESRPDATVDVIDDPEDAGQTILNGAYDTQVDVYCKVTFLNKRILYFIQRVGKAAVQGANNQGVQRQYIFSVNSTVIEDTAA